MDGIANLSPGVDFECGFVLERIVGTPQKEGKTPEGDLMLAHDKTIGMFRNGSALGYIFGEDITATRLMDDHGAVVWFHDDHPKETYSQNLVKKRARENVKDSEVTSRDTGHTSSTIDLDDFFQCEVYRFRLGGTLLNVAAALVYTVLSFDACIRIDYTSNVE